MKRDPSSLASATSARDPAGELAALGPTSVRPPTLLSLPSYLAGNVARVANRMLSRVVERQGLLLSHHAVLAALRDFGSMAQFELADRLDVDRSQIVGFVDRLEQKGCVTRVRDARDRRRILISLTDTGRRTERRITAAASRSQAALLDTLTPSEQKELLELLRRVLDNHDAARLGATAPAPPSTSG